MDSASTSASSSFGSTTSSDAHGGGYASAAPTPDMATIKAEPDDSYEPGVWAHIFDENGIVCLEDMDDEEEEMAIDISTAARPAHRDASLLDTWGCSDLESATTDAHHAADIESKPAASKPQLSTHDRATVETAAQFDEPPVAVTAYPTHFLKLQHQSDGRPYQLAKPILREDGLLLVGSEQVRDHAATTAPSNRLFVLDFRAFSPSQPTPFVPTSAEVRDLQWLDKSHYAVAAIGQDIHLIRVPADMRQGPSCQVLPPLPRVHTDAIREVAINCSSSSVVLASGGFDESVVLSTLTETGDAITATVAGNVTVHDVMSSLRWSPVDANLLSWTTDGGAFQLSDKRANSSDQLRVQLDTFKELENNGGLFTHEYISEKNVVLGFESGQLVFLDLRMPGKQICYGVMQSPIGCVGELRRAADGTCGVFGIGGFATATVSANGRELENFAGARPSHATKLGFDKFKTSGDFSAGSGSILAVSDNIGVVSVYNGNRMNASATAALLAPTSDGRWRQ